jgi:hypothetical protein
MKGHPGLSLDTKINKFSNVTDKDWYISLQNYSSNIIKEEKCDSKLDESVIALEKKLIEESVELDESVIELEQKLVNESVSLEESKYSGVTRLL